MSPTLYHVPKTISSPIYQSLIELGVANKDVAVKTLTFPDLKKPDHLARNPMGTSPAFTDEANGIAIWESGAVLTYLLEEYDTEFKLHPQPGKATKKDRATFLHLQQFIIATVYPFLASLFIHTLKPEEKQDESYVATAKGKWRTQLAPVLVNFLGKNQYFMGDKVSAIDLLAGKPLNNANSLGILEEFPTLHSLFQKVHCMPSFAEAYNETETHKSCHECRSMLLLPGDNETVGSTKMSRDLKVGGLND